MVDAVSRKLRGVASRGKLEAFTEKIAEWSPPPVGKEDVFVKMRRLRESITERSKPLLSRRLKLMAREIRRKPPATEGRRTTKRERDRIAKTFARMSEDASACWGSLGPKRKRLILRLCVDHLSVDLNTGAGLLWLSGAFVRALPRDKPYVRMDLRPIVRRQKKSSSEESGTT